MARQRSISPATSEFARAIAAICPQPRRPVVRTVPPAARVPGSLDARAERLVSNRTPRRWRFVCPAAAGLGRRLAAALRARANLKQAALLGALKPLPRTALVRDSWPDFATAIDLFALGNGQPEVRSVHVTVLTNDRPRIARVCHGAIGMNVSARMWLAGRPVAHGELVRLKRGLYPLVIEAYHGRDGTWLKWGLARLAPRFTDIRAEEIEEVHAWRLALRKATLDAARGDDDELLAQVRIDPATIRGTQGFFRVGRSFNGRWWFLDPDGRPFYHKGCTGLNAGGTGGRRAGLAPVPADEVRRFIGLLKDWGFNALGAWTTPEFFGQGLAYAETIEGYYIEPMIQGHLPDVFDPRWAENLEAKCRAICAPLKDDRQLIGYFLDNERGFMEGVSFDEKIIARSPTYHRPAAPPTGRKKRKAELRGLGLLQFCLGLDESVAGCRKAWEFLLERYGAIQNAGRAWGIEFSSPDAIRRLTARGEILIGDAYRRDLDDFVRLWVEQYYRLFVESIRKHDPNHLTLGMRHGGTPNRTVLEAEGKWADVVSRNSYRAENYEAFDEFHAACGRPVLNGEISLTTDSYTLVRNPIEPPGGYDSRTRQAVRERAAMDRLCSQPGVLGYTKYRWHGTAQGQDKLWCADRAAPDWAVVNPLRLANCRAVSIAVASDRCPRDSAPPLHGQVFICLLGGAVSVEQLRAATEGLPPSLSLKPHDVLLGFVCKSGAWAAHVYGEGIRGAVLKARTSPARTELTIRIERVSGIIKVPEGRGEYTLRLTRDDGNLEGEFAGKFNGHAVAGRAMGYLFRPAATVNL